MTKHTTATAFALIFACNAAHAGWFSKDAPPISLNDIQSITAALRPISKGGKTDVSVYVWADGDVYIYITLPNDTDIRASGATLKSALTNLTSELDSNVKQSINANEAVKAILNDGKPSQ